MNRVDLKIVLLGKEYGGKTSLVERYLNDRFLDMPYQNTIGAAFGAKRVEINSKKITLGIWDTAGGERYEAMSRIYYRGALAAVVCYDLTDISSFERAKFWVNELKKTEESCRVYLCGTKKDIVDENPAKKQVPTSQIYQYAADVDADIFETSSKSGENVKELFLKIADDYITETKHREAPVSQQQSINLSTRDKKSFSCCQ